MLVIGWFMSSSSQLRVECFTHHGQLVLETSGYLLEFSKTEIIVDHRVEDRPGEQKRIDSLTPTDFYHRDCLFERCAHGFNITLSVSIFVRTLFTFPILFEEEVEVFHHRHSRLVSSSGQCVDDLNAPIFEREL